MRMMDLIEIGENLNSNSSENNHNGVEIELPEEIGILPIRSAVAYPGTVMPLAVGRERSKRLLSDLQQQETIFGLLTQKDPNVENPGAADLYRVGTAASVLKVIKMPQGSVNVVVHGVSRFKIVAFTAMEP